MRMRKLLLIVLIILVAMLTEYDTKREHKRVDIALSMCDLDTARSAAICADVVRAAERAGLSIEVRDAKHRLSNQIADIISILNDKPRYLIISAVNSIGLRDIIQKATEQNVYVILLDRFVTDAREGDVFARIGVDAEWAGQAGAQVFAELFSDQPASILEIQGELGSSATNAFSKGFRDELCNYPNLQIAGVVRGGISRAITQRELLDYIGEHGNQHFDAVFGHGDEQGIGALNAFFSFEEHRRFPIVCIGGQDDTRRALLAGALFANVEISPHFGDAIVDLIQKNDAAEPVERVQMYRGRVHRADSAGRMTGY